LNIVESGVQHNKSIIGSNVKFIQLKITLETELFTHYFTQGLGASEKKLYNTTRGETHLLAFF
jgi:hypothetical protein